MGLLGKMTAMLDQATQNVQANSSFVKDLKLKDGIVTPSKVIRMANNQVYNMQFPLGLDDFVHSKDHLKMNIANIAAVVWQHPSITALTSLFGCTEGWKLALKDTVMGFVKTGIGMLASGATGPAAILDAASSFNKALTIGKGLDVKSVGSAFAGAAASVAVGMGGAAGAIAGIGGSVAGGLLGGKSTGLLGGMSGNLTSNLFGGPGSNSALSALSSVSMLAGLASANPALSAMSSAMGAASNLNLSNLSPNVLSGMMSLAGSGGTGTGGLSGLMGMASMLSSGSVEANKIMASLPPDMSAAILQLAAAGSYGNSATNSVLVGGLKSISGGGGLSAAASSAASAVNQAVPSLGQAIDAALDTGTSWQESINSMVEKASQSTDDVENYFPNTRSNTALLANFNPGEAITTMDGSGTIRSMQENMYNRMKAEAKTAGDIKQELVSEVHDAMIKKIYGADGMDFSIPVVGNPIDQQPRGYTHEQVESNCKWYIPIQKSRLGTRSLNIDVYDEKGFKMQPDQVHIDPYGNVTITFDQDTAGTAVISKIVDTYPPVRSITIEDLQTMEQEKLAKKAAMAKDGSVEKKVDVGQLDLSDPTTFSKAVSSSAGGTLTTTGLGNYSVKV